MRIAGLYVSNFLGLTGVDVRGRAPVQLFAGHNGAGKSSLRDAVALALTADLGRVGLKKEAPALIREGADLAVVQVTTSDGDQYQVSINAAGKITDSCKGRDSDPMMGFALDAQRFARLDPTERRAFLFGLMGVKADGPGVAERLKKKGLDPVKVERVAPLLRAGFDAACKDAKAKATEAKGAWRALTGETYGSEKAKAWHAAAPAYDADLMKQLATELQHADVALESWQQQIGKLEAEEQRRAGLQAKLPATQERALRADRIRAKLQADERTLAEQEQQLATATAAAGGGPRVGLVHDLAHLVSVAMFDAEHEQAAQTALARYEAEHGPMDAAAGDPQSAARLPELRHARDVAKSAVANDRRDLEAALQAQAEADALRAELAQPFDAAALEAARNEVSKIKAARAATVQRLDTIKALKSKADQAERVTKEAALHHADVVAWDGIADALSPDGIPAQLLAEALAPINERLAQSAADAQWPVVEISADMAITFGGREYRLLSESERWRADALIAEAISQLSGTRLLVLDRFDVLDAAGRQDLIGWLHTLADLGELDTALLFGTLKAPPAGLPPTIDVHWIENGVVGQLKEAA
jgi:hypothetical protein